MNNCKGLHFILKRSACICRLIIFWLASLTLYQTHAYGFSIDTNVFYSTDALSAEEDTSDSRTLYDISFNLNLTKKGGIFIGWSYSGITITQELNSIEADYSLTEMGPKLGFYFDKDKELVLAVVYNLIATATYDDGTTDADWRGTTLKGELGYLPKIGEGSVGIGFKLNYHSATFAESITDETTLDNVSYTRALIYPSFALTWFFD
jgi:hypothetical protein